MCCSNFIPDIYAKERKTNGHAKNCMWMVVAALITMGKKLKQTKYSSTEEWINKIGQVHSMEYYLTIQRYQILTHATTCMDLENIGLSERNESQETIYYMSLFVWTAHNRQISKGRKCVDGWLGLGGGGHRCNVLWLASLLQPMFQDSLSVQHASAWWRGDVSRMAGLRVPGSSFPLHTHHFSNNSWTNALCEKPETNWKSFAPKENVKPDTPKQVRRFRTLWPKTLPLAVSCDQEESPWLPASPRKGKELDHMPSGPAFPRGLPKYYSWSGQSWSSDKSGTVSLLREQRQWLWLVYAIDSPTAQHRISR